jgi:hypothetical protein
MNMILECTWFRPWSKVWARNQSFFTPARMRHANGGISRTPAATGGSAPAMTSSPFLHGDARKHRLVPERPTIRNLVGGVGLVGPFFLRGVFMIRCPRCKGEGIRRSRRRGFVERGPLTLVFLKPFRCKQCECRFFRWPVSFNDHLDKPDGVRERVVVNRC